MLLLVSLLLQFGAQPTGTPAGTSTGTMPDILTAGAQTGLPPEIDATLRRSSVSMSSAPTTSVTPVGTPGFSTKATPAASATPTNPMAPTPTPTPSRVEALLNSAGGVTLSQFGYDVLDGTAGSFAPAPDAPAGPDYTVSPGDRFTLSMWGTVNGSFPLEVGADGKVVLPRAGAITVWGKSLGQVQGIVRGALAKQYGEVSVALTPERLRTISVYVVGEVKRPGTYNVPSYTTVYAALAAAGGPTKDGTLRHVTLRRHGEAPRVVDLYQFLLAGDRSDDVRLQPGDTVHVDVIGRVIGIAGQVKRPGIYELPAEGAVTLKDAFALAGGRTAFGDLGRVLIDRVRHGDGRPQQVALSETAEGAAATAAWRTAVEDGDVIRVFDVLPERHDVVYLEGHVRRPGPYAFTPGMTARELLSSYDALRPEPYLDRVEIHRVLPPDDRPDLIAFDLGKLLAGDASQDVKLADRDVVHVFAKDEMDELDSVEIRGEVRRPTMVRLTPGLTVRDLVLTAGSVKPSAELDHAELVRTAKVDGKWKVTRREISLRKALDGDGAENVALQARDQLYVRQAPDWPQDAVVTLRGEVLYPGQYPFAKGERLSSVIARAGGYTPQAYLRGAFFTRLSAAEQQKERIDLLELSMEKTLIGVLAEADVKEPGKAATTTGAEKAIDAEKGVLERLKTAHATGRVVVRLDAPEKMVKSADDLLLENGDDLFIPKMPNVVQVVGEVFNPGASLWSEHLRVKDALDRVGGTTQLANNAAVFVVRADGTVISHKTAGIFRSFESQELEPGDAVIVPQKIRRFSGWQAVLDTSQLLFNLAITTGVVITALHL